MFADLQCACVCVSLQCSFGAAETGIICMTLIGIAGTIQPNGMVRCAMHVGGPVNHECSLSEFEKLGASKERRPGENIHLTNYCMALKVQAACNGCICRWKPPVHA